MRHLAKFHDEQSNRQTVGALWRFSFLEMAAVRHLVILEIQIFNDQWG